MQTKQYLGYLGLAPFALTLFFEELITDIFNISAVQIFIFYSAIILSFVSGTLWCKPNDKLSIQLQLASNLFSLLAFFALLIPQKPALMLLAVSYVIVLLAEYYFAQGKSTNHQYLNMRLQLTALVVAMHIFAYLTW